MLVHQGLETGTATHTTKSLLSPKPKKKSSLPKKKCFVCSSPVLGYNSEIGKLGAGVRVSPLESKRVEISTTDDSYIHLPKSMIEVAQVKWKILNFLFLGSNQRIGKTTLLENKSTKKKLIS